MLGLWLVGFSAAYGAAAQGADAQGAVPKNLDIYLLIGQSNMSGRGPMIASDTLTTIDGAWLFKDSLTWEPARNPLNRYSTLEAGSTANQVGPGFGFAMELHRLLPAKQFGLVVNARGGSAIASWLKPGKYYTDMLTRTRQAVKSGTLKGILWHQGESDAADTDYVAKLKGLMDSLRKDLGNPVLPVIAGQIGQFEPKHAAFNVRILTLPSHLAHSAVVKSDSLIDKGDKLHFDRASQIKLGQRYAAQAWDMIYKGAVDLERRGGKAAQGSSGAEAGPSPGNGRPGKDARIREWTIGTATGESVDSMGRRIKTGVNPSAAGALR